MSDPLSVQAAALAAVDRLIEIEREQPHIGAGLTMTLDGLEGRRRILQRHAPEVVAEGMVGAGMALCKHCADERYTVEFPCEDWRDAAAGLPLEGADHD